MSDMRLIVAGAGGRMGRMLAVAIAQTPGLVLTGALEAPGSPLLGQDAGTLAGPCSEWRQARRPTSPALAPSADALIDFTIPAATVSNAAVAAQHKLIHVIGTTGLSAEDDAAMKKAAQSTVIVKSGNMSLGVNLLGALVRRVAATLGEEFDIEIVEMHHNKKIDAPSGTALLFGEAAARGPQDRPEAALGARARRPYRRAQGGRYRLCGAARRHRGRRSQRDFRRAP